MVVYGFVDGGVNIPLIDSLQVDGPVGVQELETWQPFRVIDPFVFLLSGKNIDSHVEVLPASKLAIE